MTIAQLAKPRIRTVLDNMNLRAALIAPHYTGLASALQEYAESDFSLEEATWEHRKNQLTMAYGFGPTNPDKPFAFANGVAIIPIHGTLINRFGYSWGFITGYNFIRSMNQAALDDEDVQLIVYDCDSYGGMCAGCFETAEDIRAGRAIKPSIAVVDSNSYSACYALASAATRMVATPSSGVGSIGVVAMHMNVSEMLKNWGIEITFIFAGSHKVDGNPYEKLPDDVKKTIQTSVDKSYATFVSLVATNRNLSTEAVRATQAQTYDADDALGLGLIDAVQTPNEAVAAYLDELSGSTDQQEFLMSTTTTKPGAESENQSAAVDTNAIAAQARTAERERMAGIINCEQAKDKPKLANHLATNTDMSAADAQAVLSAAAPEVAPKAAESDAATTGKTADATAFHKAMDTGKNPEVGAGENGASAENGQEGSAAQRIIASQQAATGRKPMTH
jgi:signal peptide peptidase SppA